MQENTQSFQKERAHWMPKRIDENETHAEAGHHENSLGTKRKSLHHMEDFGFLNSKHLKLEVNGAKPSKLKEEYSPSRIPYPVTVLIKWEGRIKTLSVMQDLKKFTLHRHCSRILLQNMLYQMKGGKQEKIYGPHETEDSTRRGVEGICQIMEKMDPTTTTLHKAQKILLEA